MLDTILDGIKNLLKSRFFPIALIFLALFSALVYRLFELQIIDSREIVAESNYRRTETLEKKSSRGNIYDCNGVLLAYNKLSYSVTMVDTGEYEDNASMNAVLDKLIRIIEAYGGSFVSDFGIRLDSEGELVFSLKEDALLRFKKDVYSIASDETLTDEQIASTASEVFDFLCHDMGQNSPKFDISNKYTKEEALKILKIRYALFMNRYKKGTPITIAANISRKAVAAIEENHSIMPGIEISEETHRVYANDPSLSQILGYTATISSDMLEQQTEEDPEYNATDQIGRSGIELQYEDILRGTKGYQKVTVNEHNRIVEVQEEKEPVAGNDIYLTIDSEFQTACYRILEKKIAGILLSKIVNSTSTGSKGTSADNITIPIYDVYFALINNNVIDPAHFTHKDASSLEKQVYSKYVEKRKSVFERLNRYLAYGSKIKNTDVSKEMMEYLEYVYTFLMKQGVLRTDVINGEDAVFRSYINNEISLSEFLQYALANPEQWIDLSRLNIGDEFYTTEELYGKLMEYTQKGLKKDSTFTKKIYYYLVYSYKLSGKEICLLLFDQGVLEYNEGEVRALKSGSVSAYSFIINKIRTLKITPGQLALAPCSGSIVVTDVNTGDVKAMVSYPGYDNNRMANTIDADYSEKLYQDLSYPWLNRTTQQQTAPGSTYKMISSIASLEEQIVTADELVDDKGVFDKIEPPPHCWKITGHGKIGLSHAIGVSCNYFLYEMAYRMGMESSGKYNSNKGLKILAKYAKLFGLDEKSGVELPEAEPKLSDTDAIRSAIGQGSNNFAPIQISRYVTTIANRGSCYDLTLVKKITDHQGKTIKENKAKLHNNVKIPDNYWGLVHAGMYDVIYGKESTISSIFKDYKVKIAGKTGTAEQTVDYPNHALFVSFAPYKKPEISVTTVIPNGYASTNAAETAFNVYKYYFDKENSKELLSEEADDPTIYTSGVTD